MHNKSVKFCETKDDNGVGWWGVGGGEGLGGFGWVGDW